MNTSKHAQPRLRMMQPCAQSLRATVVGHFASEQASRHGMPSLWSETQQMGLEAIAVECMVAEDGPVDLLQVVQPDMLHRPSRRGHCSMESARPVRLISSADAGLFGVHG